ncbi:MAG TPA: haloacid dehalogenase type II [Hyphomicrobiaceae bacterium]|nr:haloacid dehalogenase type II [Hyphomicrobiaceae bacterium]
MREKDQVKAILFDVFGTVVDWRGGVIRELTAFGNGRGLKQDWAQFADDWRGLYQPSMEEVRAGRRPWVILDTLHRESLVKLLERHGIRGLSANDIEHLTTIWHRLDPWPDVIAGLSRLRKRYIIGTLSNGNIGLLTRMAKRAGLPWDVVLCAEIARAYKPMAECYVRNAEALNLRPEEVMLAAAHNGDLAAAAKAGLRTGFIVRPTEYGPNQRLDLKAEQAWDVVTDSFLGLADAMGCPR